MYKAIQLETEKEIVILDPAWSDSLKTLRDWSKYDQLVCQGCRQPVRVRAGKVRTWHFAHKHRKNCIIGNESPQLLQARALLYRWLVGKYGTERVTLEKRLSEDMVRPIDCWVSGEINFAYWIFESTLKPPNREAIHNALTQPHINAHWVFLSTMLRQDDENSERLHLTTTERKFAQKTKYDAPFSLSLDGKSLHYLDIEKSEMITYRGLELFHTPQVYEGKLFLNLLENMLCQPKTGEFVHPGEYEQLKPYEEKQKQLEAERLRLEEESRKQKEARRQQEIEHQQQEIELRKQQELYRTRAATYRPPLDFPVSKPAEKNLLAQEKTEAEAPQWTSPKKGATVGFEKNEGVCEFCGKKTRDWWQYDGKSGMCRCHTCLREGRTEPTVDE